MCLSCTIVIYRGYYCNSPCSVLIKVAAWIWITLQEWSNGFYLSTNFLFDPVPIQILIIIPHTRTYSDLPDHIILPGCIGLNPSSDDRGNKPTTRVRGSRMSPVDCSQKNESRSMTQVASYPVSNADQDKNVQRMLHLRWTLTVHEQNWSVLTRPGATFCLEFWILIPTAFY